MGLHAQGELALVLQWGEKKGSVGTTASFYSKWSWYPTISASRVFIILSVKRAEGYNRAGKAI